jgi:DNA-binding LacI/PurR family transcriptional regulator
MISAAQRRVETSNNHTGARTAVQHLITLGYAHVTLAVAAEPDISAVASCRCEAPALVLQDGEHKHGGCLQQLSPLAALRDF